MTGELLSLSGDIIASNIIDYEAVADGIFPIVSIMLGFIISVATYLSSSGIPSMQTNSLRDKIISSNLHTDIEDVLERKEKLGNKLYWIYWIIFVVLIGLGLLYLFGAKKQIISMIMTILMLLFGFLFIQFSCKIMKIINLSITIDKQLLTLQKNE